MGLVKDTATDVRRQWRAHLDRAAAQLPVTFSRGPDEFTVVSVPLLRDALRRSVHAPVVVAEDDGWSIFLDGHPVAADGGSLDEAIDDFIVSLTDYVEAWVDRLHSVPNHQHAALLAQLVATSSVDELRDWAGGSVRHPPSS
jgi:hypothetical protein